MTLEKPRNLRLTDQDTHIRTFLEGVLANYTRDGTIIPFSIDLPRSRKSSDLMIKEALKTKAIPPLSTREVQILQLRARGFEVKEIGQGFDISEHNVRNRIRNIGKKLSSDDGSSSLNSVLVAVDRQIIDPFSVIEDLGLNTESIDKLTEKQKEMLKLIVEQKYLDRELLAEKLFIAQQTVSDHLSDIRKNLSVESTIPAVILYSVYLKEQNKPKEPANIQS